MPLICPYVVFNVAYRPTKDAILLDLIQKKNLVTKIDMNVKKEKIFDFINCLADFEPCKIKLTKIRSLAKKFSVEHFKNIFDGKYAWFVSHLVFSYSKYELEM